jgi:pimeloyl-ACP methyl ester carboxylesterase
MRLTALLAMLTVVSPALAQDEPPQREQAEPQASATGAEARAPDGDAAAGFEWLRAPGYDTVVCPFRGRIDYERGDLECGLIQVPENREVAGSRTIELHFVKINARGEDEAGDPVEVRDDPVLYLTGGPGVEVETYVRRLKDHPVADQRDLYILEQRGIGYSGEFCPFFGDRNRAEYAAETFAESERQFLEQARQCIEGAKAAGVDVTGYHTFENARDIKALRLALGFERWNIWGISYGSVLGQAYMKVDPEGIAAVVIDAIVPLDLENLMRLPHWHKQNLDRLFGACGEQADCAAHYGGLRERYRDAIRALTEAPIRVEVPEGERYPTGETRIFQNLIVGLPFSLLYEQSNHPAIPAIIDGLTRKVEQRDADFFKAVALGDTSGGVGLSMGMSIAVRCQDGYVDRQAENAAAEFRDYPVLAQAFGVLEVIEDSPAACREIGLPPRDPEQFEPVETDLPVVVANGRWDPITPVPMAEYIMPGLSNGRLVVFPHAGHGPTRSLDCAGDFLNGFFDDPSAELDMECVEEGEEAAEFIAPYFATAAAVDGLVLYETDDDRIKVHAAWGGGSALVVLIGTLAVLAAWIGRRLNGRAIDPAGSSRFIVFLAGLSSLGYVGGLGAAAKATTDVTEAMVLFGLVPWAGWIAWLGPLSLLLGLGGLIQSWRYRRMIALDSRLGLWLVSAAVISVAAFGLVWDLWPL